MKRFIFFVLPFVLLTALAVPAQDYGRLENLADELRNQAEELTGKTSRRLDRNSANPRASIEEAFLAEQFLAGASFIGSLIGDEFPVEDLREAGAVLSELTRRFPVSGANGAEWRQIQAKVEELNAELRATNAGVDAPHGNPGDISGRVFWTGMVDATVHLVIRGSSLETRTISGKAYSDGIPSFTRTLPTSGNVTVGANKKEGRGSVKVIQQPSAANDYTAIVEIFDEGGGAKSYTVEVFWN
jgi:hypothetical protein